MFSMQNRGEMPEITEREFENLVSRLRQMLLTEHEPTGKHRGVTYTGPVTTITIVNGIVTAVS